MIYLVEIFLIIFFHFIGDVVLQSEWQNKNKGTDNLALTLHAAVYSIIWWPITSVFFYFHNPDIVSCIFTGLFFATITFMCHWVTDYVSGKLNTIFIYKNEDYNVLLCSSWDQMLHYGQLFLTYYTLKSLC